MTQRFNPPPGWNVPPEFVPSADWQPDPSWPAAPDGWNYWVEVDAAQPTAAEQPSYGSATDQPLYGSPSYSQSADAAPPGAYSTAPGTAQAAMAEAQLSGAKRNALIGAGLLVLTVVVAVAFDRLFYFFPIIGIVLIIKGLVDMNKAKKAIAASIGPYGAGSNPGGITPPGQNPPGTF